LQTLSEEERKLFSLYGKLPTHKNTLMKMQKERKFFDSGDYALSKAGKTPEEAVGTAIPNPQNIPHASPPAIQQSMSISPTNSTSPVKESLLSNERDSENSTTNPEPQDAPALEETATK
ncbi:hypothetical protein SCHPADRAFT_821709, partial [Schizopora paradoxa]